MGTIWSKCNTEYNATDYGKNWNPKGIDSGYDELAKMVVLQAIDDYRLDVKKLRKKKYQGFDLPSDVAFEKKMIQIDMDQIRHFLGSEWASCLSGIEKDVLMRGLSEEYIDVDPRKELDYISQNNGSRNSGKAMKTSRTEKKTA